MVGLTYKEFSNQLVPDRRWKLYLMRDLLDSPHFNLQTSRLL